jgi:hypothetical protein
MNAPSGKVKPVIKWLGLLVGGMMMLSGFISTLTSVLRLPFSGSGFLFTLLGLGMSALIAWLGWKLIEATGTAMSIRMAMKILLLLTGIMMLLGGGMCAVSNAYVSIASGLGGYGGIALMLMAISCLTAWLGWVAIKRSNIKLFRQENAAEETEIPADAENK